jgi:hypothetical protein
VPGLFVDWGLSVLGGFGLLAGFFDSVILLFLSMLAGYSQAI